MGLIFYGDKNHFWIEKEKRFDLPLLKAFLTEHKIALYDTARRVRRLKDNASDKFLDIVDAPKRIGVCVNESLLLTPTKSVTCVIGLGHDLSKGTMKSCDMCTLGGRCTFRLNGGTCQSRRLW